MNPMNWISATGFRPWAAIPTAMPVISVSASGVSMTRRKPKRSCNPTVARNTPPLGPTSSPSTTTSGSSAMARCSAMLIASTMQMALRSVMADPSPSGGPDQQFFPLLVVGRGQLGKQIIEGCPGVRRRQGAERIHRGTDLLAELLLQPLFAGLVPEALAVQEALQPTDGFVLPGLAQLLGLAVAAGIIRGGVIAQAIGHAFNQGRPFARPGPLDGRAEPVVDRQHIIAVHLFPGNTGSQGLVGQGGRGGLQAARHRDGPLVVVHHEHHGQLPNPG